MTQGKKKNPHFQTCKSVNPNFIWAAAVAIVSISQTNLSHLNTIATWTVRNPSLALSSAGSGIAFWSPGLYCSWLWATWGAYMLIVFRGALEGQFLTQLCFKICKISMCSFP